MRSAEVLYNGQRAGVLSQTKDGYRFVYDASYLALPDSRPVSVTLPLRKAPFDSAILFPAFVNMLSEGSNKQMQTRLLSIDENDYFSLLLATAEADSIGPITFKAIDESSPT